MSLAKASLHTRKSCAGEAIPLLVAYPNLIKSINEDRKDVLQTYFKHNTSLINQSDPLGWTPLKHAVNTNYLHIVKILCDHGANANIIDAQNRNPLTMASEKGFLDITKILLTKTCDLYKVDINGMSALMHASKSSHKIRKLRQSVTQVGIVCKEDMLDHPFIDLLQRLGWRLRTYDEERHRQIEPAKKTDWLETMDKAHIVSDEDFFTCKSTQQINEIYIGNMKILEELKKIFHLLSSQDEPLCSPGDPLSSQDEPLSDACGGLTDKCEIAVLDLISALEDAHLTESSSDKEDEETCLHYFQLTEHELKLLNTTSHCKELRQEIDSTLMADDRDNENKVVNEDGQETIVIRNTHQRLDYSNRRKGFYSESMFCKGSEAICVPRSRSNTDTNVKNLNVKITVVRGKVQFNIEKCENLVMGDKDCIEVLRNVFYSFFSSETDHSK
ncbi:hypothetical protein Btru_063615 [Bulinus truncatus]|nr:hypothetical protein Btru_063615 [Bulinus truncatus]